MVWNLLLHWKKVFLEQWIGLCYNNIMWFQYDEEEYMIRYTEEQRKRGKLPKTDMPTVCLGLGLIFVIF